MTTQHRLLDAPDGLLRNAFETAAHRYYDSKRDDALNLDLGHTDGFYHHHFAVGDFDHRVLDLTGPERERAIGAELHRMETQQVDLLVDGLRPVASGERVLDAGSGRGGTALLLHRSFGCDVDGVNFSGYQNAFARAEAERLGCAEQVRFHDRNMADTGFPAGSFDHVVSNETTMYVDVGEAFHEFSRLLRPGGTYVMVTWCRNDAVSSSCPEAEAIDAHYRCRTHSRGAYLRALLTAGLVPYRVEDLTREAMPYWELRSQYELASGIEAAYVNGYRSDRVNYVRIAARKPSTGTTGTAPHHKETRC
jgi:geranyl diphosphate 2-C-methyltransferase